MDAAAITRSELEKLESAMGDPVFRQLLCEYVSEVRDPENKALYEAEVVRMEAERGVKCTFLHPGPGYAIKTRDGEGRKSFVNVCFDPNVEAPAGRRDVDVGGRAGFRWSLPYFQSRPREERDRAGRRCQVYDVIFNPEAEALAASSGQFKRLLDATALEAVEKAFRVELDRRAVAFPRLKFKGSFRPTVIREQIVEEQQRKEVETTTPRHSVKQVTESSMTMAASDRPTSLVVTIELPDLSSAKGVVLDVMERQLTLDGEGYRLDLDLPYPVEEDGGSAKFDKSAASLVVTLPVKPAAALPVSRLFSTDSGIGLDFEPEAPEEPEEVEEAEEVAMMPPYSCNIYEELIVIKLDVRNVDEGSLRKEPVVVDGGREVGFELRFSNVGAGMVPFDYRLMMVLVADKKASEEEEEEDREEAEDDDVLSNVEVEVWENNVIVQMVVPKHVEQFKTYKVGPTLDKMIEHPLPPLKAFRRKREELKKKERLPETAAKKERHSSGDSLDSAISVSPPQSPLPEAHSKEEEDDDDDEAAFAATDQEEVAASTRGILKRCVRRCFSESQAESLRWAEEEEEAAAAAATSGPSKKTVRFNDVVQRQVFKASASILGQKHKNQKKAEQKLRRRQLHQNQQLERRASEGDAVGMLVEDGFKISASFENKLHLGAEGEDHDSGIASSCEDHNHSVVVEREEEEEENAKDDSMKQQVRGGKKGRSGNRQKLGRRNAQTGSSSSCCFVKDFRSELLFELDF